MKFEDYSIKNNLKGRLMTDIQYNSPEYYKHKCKVLENFVEHYYSFLMFNDTLYPLQQQDWEDINAFYNCERQGKVYIPDDQNKYEEIKQQIKQDYKECE